MISCSVVCSLELLKVFVSHCCLFKARNVLSSAQFYLWINILPTQKAMLMDTCIHFQLYFVELN